MIERIVLANLTLPPLSGLTKTSPHHQKPRTLFGHRRTIDTDEEHLNLFSEILLNADEEATFDVLYSQLPFTWHNEGRYDVINPFGDDRDCEYHAIWTFDTQNGVLYYTNHNSRRKVSLTLLRKRVVSLARTELLDGPFPPPSDPIFDVESRFWKPRVSVPHRTQAFICRILRNFDYQWRHILRNPYNSMTLQVFARAVIRISILDFEIRQNTGGHSPRGLHVWITHLPAWEPFSDDIVRVGKVWVVLCQEIQEGLLMARQHLSSQRTTELPIATDPCQAQAHYMVLSIKHIMLCHATGPESLEYTAPEPLFNGDCGTGSPSDLALSYLLWATTSARPSIFTPIQLLPIEIQDIILNNVSIGTVEAAKVGCLLNVGTPFSWTDGPLKVVLTERYYVRPPGMPAESHIWFGAHKSGIVYLAQDG